MTWIEEVSYQYRDNEFFFIDLPAIFQFCMPTLLVQFVRLVLLQVAINVPYQLITSDVLFRNRFTTKNILSSTLGTLVLLYFYPPTSVILLLSLVVLAYLLVTNRKLIFLILSAAITTGWLMDVFSVDLRAIQGPLMIFVMKVICVVGEEPGDFSLFIHYSLSPSSTVFGPIVPFDAFKKNVFQSRLSLPFRAVLGSLTATFLTFITANCICQSVEWVSAEDFPPFHVRFLGAYKDAFEFRMSHYFISYLSTLQMQLGAPKLAEPVAEFWTIEVPRSTRSVVRGWNRPMHKFLKKYVFQKIRPLMGASFAVVSTFLISAALHLFEIRVFVVLFGLSIVSLVESRLERNLPKSVADLWFRCTTFIHLVFFGCIMQGYDEAEDGSYFSFTMERWLGLGFISFKIILLECVVCLAFELRRVFKGQRSSE